MYQLPEELWHLIQKTIIPAFIAVTVSIAIQMKHRKMTIISGVLAYVIGVGMAFIFGQEIHEHLDSGAATIMIGTIAITGEKIGYWLIFRFKFDQIGESLIKALKKWIE